MTGPDNCPACGFRITDVDPGGCELVTGQRWCLWHVPADQWADNFGDITQPAEPGDGRGHTILTAR